MNAPMMMPTGVLGAPAGPGGLAPAPPPVAPREPIAMDAKTALNQFCQRLCQRPVTRSDIEYTVNKIGVQFQAIVKLNCIQGQEFAGELSMSPKEAEKAAAEQALKAHQMTIESLPPTATPKQKKKEKTQAARSGQNADGGVVRAKPPDEENPALTAKVKLNSLCMRIVKRALQKGETAYDTKQAIGGFHCTLKLHCLPNEWDQQAWAGMICTTKQAAEQSAATFALQAIEADEALMAIANQSKLETNEGKGKGRSKGKGFKGKGKAMDLGALQEAMMPWLGKGRSGPDLEREVVNEELVTGEIIEWKSGGKFGWIKLDTAFEHKSASRRDGKVYAHKQDLKFEAEELAPGTKVKFILYVDPAGLGAQSITLV